jgi:hypothetical protein
VGSSNEHVSSLSVGRAARAVVILLSAPICLFCSRLRPTRRTSSTTRLRELADFPAQPYVHRANVGEVLVHVHVRYSGLCSDG